MKNIIKKITVFLLLCMIILLISQEVLAINSEISYVSEMELSDEFKAWMELSDEEKEKVMMPRIFDVKNSKIEYKNPFYLTRMLGSTLNSRYSLKDVIPNNVKIRNQKLTNSCWAFAALSSLETNLALSDYKNGINTSKVYDFSERHMEYATSKNFMNNVKNPIGYNRNVGDGGNWGFAESYLINGTGAVLESAMPFENNENLISINEIQNKTVSSQVYDTIYFENYKDASSERKVEIINQIKQHIKNYGSVFACIHGNSSNSSLFTCYNSETGAKYCSNYILHQPDHAVSIIGWDDNYSINNFPENARPNNNGAWIIRNSWGERKEYSLLEVQQYIYNTYPNECNSKGWTDPTLIPNQFIEALNFTIEGNVVYGEPIGDYGLMYVSYEDANISTSLSGIIKSSEFITYDNIYQYDEYIPTYVIPLNYSKVMMANIFEKESYTEYLTQVSLHAAEKYTCRVYVNPTGASLKKEDMKLIPLKAGDSETFDSGYHTLEFLEPVALTGTEFAVVIEITGTNASTGVMIESKVEGISTFDSVTVQNDKCFVTLGHNLENCEWIDLSKLSQLISSYPDGDSTIKAFTVNEIKDGSLKKIEIKKPPTKTTYIEGENFDKTGMVVTATYNRTENPYVILDSSSYNITNGTNLQVGQTSVTITYEDKSVEQPITVIKNSVTDLKIVTPPTKTEYKEGQNFDKTGMIIEAVRKDGSKENVTNYTIEDGNNLKLNQTSVTISYEGKKVEQEISVTTNSLVELKISKEPNKINYVVGQNFDKTGMVIIGIYEDGSTIEILDYTIENGENLKENQTLVIISYLGKTVAQNITVSDKEIVEISINKNPNKLKYIQNKELLDLTGGSIIVSYNDGTKDIIDMDSEEITVSGFDNKTLGKVTITVKYQTKTAKFDIEIIEEEKAENSKMSNAKGDVKCIKGYYFTDDSKKDYTLIDVEINNIEKNLNNDKIEYYYYLSTVRDEENITDWVKITENQKENDKLKFTISSKEVPNYNEISKENVLYLYVKEVAIKGGNQSVAINKALELTANADVEVYIDNVKKENVNSNGTINNQDTTISGGKLPQAGVKTIVSLVVITIVIGGFFYFKYNKLKDIK